MKFISEKGGLFRYLCGMSGGGANVSGFRSTSKSRASLYALVWVIKDNDVRVQKHDVVAQA